MLLDVTGQMRYCCLEELLVFPDLRHFLTPTRSLSFSLTYSLSLSLFPFRVKFPLDPSLRIRKYPLPRHACPRNIIICFLETRQLLARRFRRFRRRGTAGIKTISRGRTHRLCVFRKVFPLHDPYLSRLYQIPKCGLNLIDTNGEQVGKRRTER